MIDKYETRVFSTTCVSPTDAISDCLKVDCVRKRCYTRDAMLARVLAVVVCL